VAYRPSLRQSPASFSSARGGPHNRQSHAQECQTRRSWLHRAAPLEWTPLSTMLSVVCPSVSAKHSPRISRNNPFPNNSAPLRRFIIYSNSSSPPLINPQISLGYPISVVMASGGSDGGADPARSVAIRRSPRLFSWRRRRSEDETLPSIFISQFRSFEIHDSQHGGHRTKIPSPPRL
jgi:hypothetical protein